MLNKLESLYKANVELSILEINSIDSIDSILLEKLKDKIGNRCNNDGYLLENNIIIKERSIGKYYKQKILYDIIYKASIFHPFKGGLYPCKIVSINTLGYICKSLYYNMCTVIIPSMLVPVKTLKIGTIIQVIILDSYFKANDDKIIIIGQLYNKNIKILNENNLNKLDCDKFFKEIITNINLDDINTISYDDSMESKISYISQESSSISVDNTSNINEEIMAYLDKLEKTEENSLYSYNSSYINTIIILLKYNNVFNKYIVNDKSGDNFINSLQKYYNTNNKYTTTITYYPNIEESNFIEKFIYNMNTDGIYDTVTLFNYTKINNAILNEYINHTYINTKTNLSESDFFKSLKDNFNKYNDEFTRLHLTIKELVENLEDNPLKELYILKLTHANCTKCGYQVVKLDTKITLDLINTDDELQYILDINNDKLKPIKCNICREETFVEHNYYHLFGDKIYCNLDNIINELNLNKKYNFKTFKLDKIHDFKISDIENRSEKIKLKIDGLILEENKNYFVIHDNKIYYKDYTYKFKNFDNNLLKYITNITFSIS